MIRLLIISLFVNILFSDDRSTIYNTGSPSETDTTGFLINSTNSAANRFILNNNYVLEAMVFFVSLQSSSGNITISIREDDNNSPGNLISESATWDHELNPLSLNNYNLITTTNLCIYLDEATYYWWTIETTDENTEAIWFQKESLPYYSVSSSNDGLTWNLEPGIAGSGAIYGEQIYENANIPGDVNSDFIVNVIDIVSIIGYITETSEFNLEQIEFADINNDGFVNVVDIVQLVTNIVTPNHPNPNFNLEDINPASEFFMQNIGPSFFNGQVSAYYFGKQG